jgi:hypothetical protein
VRLEQVRGTHVIIGLFFGKFLNTTAEESTEVRDFPTHLPY